MADGTVRGTFELNTPALRSLRDMREEGRRTTEQMRTLGTTLDRLGGATATTRIDSYNRKVREVGTTATATRAVVGSEWDAMRRTVDDQSRRMQVSIDDLQHKVDRFGRSHAAAHVELNGFDRVNAQISELEARLDRLSRKRATPNVSIGGGFSNFAGGMGGGLSGASNAAGGASRGGGGILGLIGSHPLIAGAAALSPAIPALGGAAIGLGASAGQAVLGAGVVGLGAAGTLGVGGGLTAVVAREGVKNLQAAEKAQTSYTKAVQEFGAASRQAVTAKRNLDQAFRSAPGSQPAVQALNTLQAEYRTAMAPAYRQFYGGVAGVAGALRPLVPNIGRNATRATGATAGAATSFAGFLGGSQTRGTVTALTTTYTHDLPMIEHSLQNIATVVEHLAVDARPFFTESVRWVDHWTGGLATASGNTQKVDATMTRMVNSAKDWARLGGATYRTLRDIFNLGAPSGDSMVVSLTHTLDRWDTWIQRNPAKVKDFFSQAERTTSNIAGGLVSIVHLLGQFVSLITPIFDRATQFLPLLGALGPGGTTALLGGLYGGFGGLRGGGRGGGGGGIGPGALAASYVLGRPVGMGPRLGGGAVVGGGAALRATSPTMTRYLMPPAAFGGAPAAAGQLPLFAPAAGGYAANAGARRLAAGAATPESFAQAYGHLPQARYGAPVSTIEGRPGLLSQAGARARGFGAGALRSLGPLMVLSGLLQGVSTQGNFVERSQAALSGLSFGILPTPTTGHAAGTAAADRGSGFLQQLSTDATGAPTIAGANALIRRYQSLQSLQGYFSPGGATGLAGLSPAQQHARMIQAQQAIGTNLTSPHAASAYSAYMAAIRPAYTQVLQQLPTMLDQRSVAHAQQLSGELGGTFNVYRRAGEDPSKALGDASKGMIDKLRGMREAGAKTLATNTLEWARQQAKSNPALVGVVDQLQRDIVSRFRAMGRNVQVVNGQILDGSKTEWAQISTAMSDPIETARERMSTAFTAIQQQAVGSLQAMGFSPAGARALVQGMENGGAQAKTARSAVAGQQLGGPGTVTGQAQASLLGIGQGAQRAASRRHARGGQIGGQGLLDTIPVPGGVAAPGEAWIANRHTLNKLSLATIARYGLTAEQMIGTETRPHSMPLTDGGIMPDAGVRFALGGNVFGQIGAGVSRALSGLQRQTSGVGAGNMGAMVAEANAITARHYPYLWGGGHDANFTGPYDCSGAVSAVLHAGGLLGSPQVSGWFENYGSPGPGPVTLFANAGHVYMRMGNRYFGTSTANPGGGAAWFNGAPRPGFVVRHVNASGGAQGAMFTNAVGGYPPVHLRAPRSGMPGVPGVLADSGSAMYAAGLTQKINHHLAGLSGGMGGAFNQITGTGGTPTANQQLGRQMMLAAGWGADQWPALQALWTQESGWNANSVNSSSGAYGIPQALGHGHPFALGDARGQIAWGLNYIRQRYGSPGAAEQHERANNWYQRGGRAAWGGWNAGGGSFVTNGPTVFGVGEVPGRPERVNVTSAHGGGGGGSRSIAVNIDKLVMPGTSPKHVEDVAREVAGKILDALDAAAGGATDTALVS